MQRPITGGTKAHLRSRFLEMRREMTFEQVFALSASVQKRFLETPAFLSLSGKGRPADKTGARPARLGLYSAFQNEVLTDDVFAGAVKAGHEVYYPRVIKGARCLRFYRVKDASDLASGAYDIKEPRKAEKEISPATLDLIVVPGAAFDTYGTRLGFGKGYYDMVLKDAACPIAGLAYDFQVVSLEIEAEAHDVAVSFIVTEKRVIEAKGRKG